MLNSDSDHGPEKIYILHISCKSLSHRDMLFDPETTIYIWLYILVHDN